MRQILLQVPDEMLRQLEKIAPGSSRKRSREGDVVVTHYLPAEASVAPAWKTSALNPFFVCDVEALIRERRPALWIHGHTHASIDTTLGETRIVCNPFGYVRVEENRAFREDACVAL